MDFGLDNEFESDDSFFDDPKLTKKAQQPKTTEKKSVEDIFGFQDEGKKLDKSGQNSLENIPDNPNIKPKVRFNVEESILNEKPSETSKFKTPDWLSVSEDPKDSVPSKTNPKGDIFDDVLSSVPSKTDSKRSFDLLDDLLPQRGRKLDQTKPTSLEDILKESKVERSGPGSLERTQQKSGPGSLEVAKQEIISSTLSSQKNPSEGLNMILEPPQGHRRGRRGSTTGVTDILGLFGSGPASAELVGDAKASGLDEKLSTTKSLGKDMPDWLGGSSTTINKSDTTISIQKSEHKEPESAQPPKIPEPESKITHSVQTPQSLQAQEPPSNNFQANMSNLQAQESFLLVSLQLKKYEENLSEIKHQQHEILRKQEDQFDTFLSKYIEKQKNIEHEMFAQQERINEHIRAMALSGFEGRKRMPAKQDEGNTDDEESKQGKEESIMLEKIVQSLKQRHDEEFFLMEESYKKQISLLEKSSEQIEQRLSQEIENTSKLYEEKLANLKKQQSEELNYWSEKMKTLEEKHKEEIESMKETHNRVLREVKDEFLDQIERVKEQRIRESELFASSNDLAQKLSHSVEKLDRNEGILERIQEKVVKDYDVLSMARERSIENKEKEITAMRLTLEKCREQAEKDRSQLLALIRTLEQRISQQDQNTQEERWALQQAAATIAARSAAFDREVEFSRASIEREREQLKTLKEALLAEQEKIALQLTEEKLKLSAEKSRLEVSAKLVNNYEIEKIKTEAETAIQVAKELTEKLNLERSFVQRQKVELEGFRSKLMEKERDILEREEHVEEMRRKMQQKSSEDRRVLQETKYLENRYREKLSELQAQAMSLSNREKKLAEEKLLISKERMALYTSMKSQSGQKKCMLCKAEEEKFDRNEALFATYSATDPDFVRLRIEATEEERNSEVSREDCTPNNLYNSEAKIG